MTSHRTRGDFVLRPARTLRLSLGLLVLACGSAAATDITTCGQSVADRDTGVLVADLDCPRARAVTVGHHAKLQLNGHAVAGEILCNGTCTVTGPGDVSQGSAGISVNNAPDRNGSTLRIQQVTLHDNLDGIGDGARRLVLSDVVSSNNVGEGINWSVGSIRGRNVTTSNNGTFGIHAGQGIVRINNLTATGNGDLGLVARRAVLVNSLLTGNAGTSSTPQDFSSSLRPRLVNTTCGHSVGPGGTWGVCTND